jgi:C-terminal processing protease CtpA/Prc
MLRLKKPMLNLVLLLKWFKIWCDPKFYIDFENKDGRDGKDIALEVERLKAANVDGIVLDVRDDGGSLSTVVDIAGLYRARSYRTN